MKAVDLFAGLGGWTEGAGRAGVRVVWAGNHWRAACDNYHANNPRVRPVCQDLRQADWHALPRHEVQLASPSCTGHTRARGRDKPRHDSARATAWAVIDCAEVWRQPLIVVENVVEFLSWELYPAWRFALQSLGYAVAPHVVDAADHGVPQHRERVFIVCTRSKSPLELELPRREHIPCAHILERERSWTPLRGLCANTRARASVGRRTYGARFIMAYYGAEKGGRSLRRPLGTVTTRDRFALIDGENLSMLTVGEYRRAMGFPDDYRLPDNRKLAVHLPGNAVPPPVAADVLQAALRRL